MNKIKRDPVLMVLDEVGFDFHLVCWWAALLVVAGTFWYLVCVGVFSL